MPRSLALCLVLCAVGAVPAPLRAAEPFAAEAQAFVPPVPDARLLAAAQRVLDPARRQGRTNEELGRALAALGADVAPVLVAMLVGDAETTDWEAAGLTLAQAGPSASGDRALLLEALRLLPEVRVARALSAACAADAPLDRRLVGLSALAEVGRASGVETWLGLAQGIEPIHFERAYIRAQLDGALAHCLEAAGEGFDFLERRLPTLSEPLFGAIVRATAQSGRARGVEFLFRLRGRGAALDLELVVALSTLAAHTLGDVGPERSAWLCEQLGAEDARMRQCAALALGRVADPTSAAALIRALGDAEPAVVNSARTALESLAGLRGPNGVQGWEQWLAEEQRWADGEFPRLRAELQTGGTDHALEAAAALTRHPLYRHESARLIAAELARRDAHFARSATAALALLGSAGAVPALVELLAVDDPELKRVAHEALRLLSGRTLPADADAWRSATRD